MKFYEKVSRSFAKSITFRVLVLISDSFIIYFITHRFDTTLEVIIFSNIFSTVLYFFHERVWTKIHWGKVHQ